MTPQVRGDAGAQLLEEQLSRVRVKTAHRLGAGLLVEADLRRAGRPDLVPFVLSYSSNDLGTWSLERAHAGASSVNLLDGDRYLFLSDAESPAACGADLGGRSLLLQRADTGVEPEVLLRTGRDIVSYTASASAAVAAVWMRPEAAGFAQDLSIRRRERSSGKTASIVSGDLWPRSGYHLDGEVLRLLKISLHHDREKPRLPSPELLPLRLELNTRLTGALSLTPDGLHCAAGIVRFLRGGHRRHGLLLFSLASPSTAHARWGDRDDLMDPVAAPDGTGWACTAERIARPGMAPRQHAVFVPADGAEPRSLATAHEDWLQPRAWADERTVLCTGEQDGRRRLWRVDRQAASPERVECAGSVLDVTVSGQEAVITRSAIDLPPEVVVVPLGQLSTDRRTLIGHSAHDSRRGAPCFAPASAVEPAGRMERLSYQALDGSRWHSWLCLPPEAAEELPVLVWCHGGPLLSWTDWSWRWNPWPYVAEGYAVLMPDPPLSLGYGQAAIERGWGRWTSEVAAIAAQQIHDALKRPDLDATRVAVMGGSFGGFLALALGTVSQDFRLIVSHCGWADFSAVARASDLHWHWLREYGTVGNSSYHDESLQLSAILHTSKVMLSHGCEDPHVPVGEARAICRELDTRGVDVELMLLPEERHSIRRPANVRAWYDWVIAACRENLTPGPGLEGDSEQ